MVRVKSLRRLDRPSITLRRPSGSGTPRLAALFPSLGASLPYTFALPHLLYLVHWGDIKNNLFCPGTGKTCREFTRGNLLGNKAYPAAQSTLAFQSHGASGVAFPACEGAPLYWNSPPSPAPTPADLEFYQLVNTSSLPRVLQTSITTLEISFFQKQSFALGLR